MSWHLGGTLKREYNQFASKSEEIIKKSPSKKNKKFVLEERYIGNRETYFAELYKGWTKHGKYRSREDAEKAAKDLAKNRSWWHSEFEYRVIEL